MFAHPAQVCDYYVHEVCMEFAVPNCVESATFDPMRENANAAAAATAAAAAAASGACAMTALRGSNTTLASANATTHHFQVTGPVFPGFSGFPDNTFLSTQSDLILLIEMDSSLVPCVITHLST